MAAKSRFSTVCALFLGFLCAEIPAQEVYVTRGENGPVFSDKPQPGSRELDLKPLTVIPAPPKSMPASGANEAEPPSGGAEARQDRREPPEAAAPYRSLTVVRPQDGGGVAGDTPFLEVRLAVDPPLQLSERHAFVANIDGRPVGQRFTATDFTIPPGFWEDGYLPSNRGMQLEVAIVDGDGQVVMQASPVYFRSLPVLYRPPPHPPRPGGHSRSPRNARPAPPPPENPGKLVRPK